MLNNKSKDTTFNMVNVDELLGKEPEEFTETTEPAPVIEKVSLAEINEEKEAEEIDEVADAVKDYLALTPEERAEVRKILFN